MAPAGPSNRSLDDFPEEVSLILRREQVEWLYYRRFGGKRTGMASLDRIDRRILRELQADGRLSIVELARRVHLTKTPCAERVHRLEREGVIHGYQARLDPQVLGADHVAFVQVSLKGTTEAELEQFNAAVRGLPEVQSCHMIAGGFDYLLKVRTRDIAEYRYVLGEKISRLPVVQQTHTYVVMESVKDETTLPVRD
ncbi:proline dehydrogenase transcriptional activator [Rhodospirillum rubrum]|nr:proline dehydrogenase transcriptional activator [Rhodospirillum rubrum]MBK1677704.1 proline dehydrogenase transcriptional activator [Rhodospirillum rubrum]